MDRQKSIMKTSWESNCQRELVSHIRKSQLKSKNWNMAWQLESWEKRGWGRQGDDAEWLSIIVWMNVCIGEDLLHRIRLWIDKANATWHGLWEENAYPCLYVHSSRLWSKCLVISACRCLYGASRGWVSTYILKNKNTEPCRSWWSPCICITRCQMLYDVIIFMQIYTYR